MKIWVKKLLLIDLALLFAIATVFFFYNSSLRKFNEEEHISPVYFNEKEDSGNESLFVNAMLRGGDTGAWAYDDYNEDGSVCHMWAEIYDTDIINDTKYKVHDWKITYYVNDDCFINDGWVGEFEIHQTDENGNEVVETLDIQKFDDKNTRLKFRRSKSVLLIPLKKGDSFTYIPSEEKAEILKSDLKDKKFESSRMGFIIYYPSEPVVALGSGSFCSFKLYKNFFDGYTSHVILTSLILVVLWTIFYISIQLCRSYDLKKNEEEKKKLSYDSLTGLYNRNHFIRNAEILLLENPDEKFIIVCTNIKGFKFFNYAYGEAKGNEFLKNFGNLIVQLGENYSKCVYGRLWRDEFVILLPEKEFNEEDFKKILTHIKEQIETDSYRVQLKFAAYRIQDNSESVAMMCDKALMAGKSSTNDINLLFSYYDEKMLLQSMNERWVVTNFEKGLRSSEFLVYLQPQVTPDGICRGAEALVRWNHPEKGLISPGIFVPVLEQAGVIHKLDRFVWEESVRTLANWKENGKEDYYISVNISGRDFEMFDLYEVFTNLVEKYGVSPKKLKLEVTETVMLEKGIQYTSIIKALRFYGFSIEIDDFGSGYSSLNTLKDISADVIKIDMKFLQGNTHVDRGNIIIQSVINMVHVLEMSVVTEGVETLEQVELLKVMGCDVFQGFYFAKPMPIADFQQKYF